MVTTRSGKETIKEKEPQKEKKSKVKKPKFKIVRIQDDEENDDDDFFTDSEEDYSEESYPIPRHVEKNKKLAKDYKKLIQRIKSKEPTMEKILKAKIRMKRKLDLIQEYFILTHSYPYTEERFFLKKRMNEKLKYYKQEFQEFKKNKTKFSDLESIEKNDSDMMLIKSKLIDLETSPKNLQLLFQKFNSLEAKQGMDEEYFKALNWLKSCLKLPFNRVKEIPFQSEISKFLLFIRNELDRELYSMVDVKEQILLYVHNRIMNPLTQNFPLCLIGKPGIGKTSIALVLSKVLNLPFQQINMGGATNAEFLLGFDSTYVGAKPGRIANAMISSGYKNGIIFFDEFDKATENKDIVSSMLHITDPAQNKSFRDHFFGEIEIDLSNCWFIMSMNEKPMDKALNDRMCYIHINEYTEKEKFYIVKNYLLPKATDNLNLNPNDIQVDDHTIYYMIRKISPGESGIRLLKQTINEMLSKIIFLVNNQELETSFSFPKEKRNVLQLPFHITNYVVDQLIKNKTERINPSILHMYV